MSRADPANPSSISFKPNATLISSTKNTLFNLCSAYNGQATIGTPTLIASSTEFHPQWVTNPPTESWLSAFTCGAHCFTTNPLSFVLSKKPLGNNSFKFGSFSLCGDGFLTTHKNLWLFSNPTAISFNCFAANNRMLPKDRNTTLRLSCEFSDFKHSCSSPSWLLLDINGPIQNIGGVTPYGTHSPSDIALIAFVSSESKHVYKNSIWFCHVGRCV